MQITPHENIYYRVKEGKPYLIGSRCKNCDYVAFPKRVVCPSCISKDSMKDIELSRTGKLDTFSILHVAAPGFSVPYAVGYVNLPEGPRIFSMITYAGESLEIGDEVELMVGKIREDELGNEVIGYKFKVPEAKKGDEK